MTIRSQRYPDDEPRPWAEDPLHDERQEQRRVEMEEGRPTSRVNGQRYDPDDLPSRDEL